MSSLHRRNEDIYETIAANIKRYRKEAKITQAELADRAHYSHEYIRRIEAPNGKKCFSMDTLAQISNALGIKLEDLVKGIDNEEK